MKECLFPFSTKRSNQDEIHIESIRYEQRTVLNQSKLVFTTGSGRRRECIKSSCIKQPSPANQGCVPNSNG